MEPARRIYVFSKERLLLQQKVECFVSKVTELQILAKEAQLIVLIDKSKGLARELQACDSNWLAGGANLTGEKVNQMCAVLARMEILYQDYTSQYIEILQNLLKEKLKKCEI